MEAPEGTRVERDALGPVAVPAQRLWGAQTQRSLEHFAISTERMPLRLIHALVEVKRACARVNAEQGRLDGRLAEAIVAAADEVLSGQLDDEFPLSVWQTGSGTQSHMNVNEVLANRASERLGGSRGEGRLVHPNDHVNLGQSSNDVFPTAMHLAAVRALAEDLLPRLTSLRDSLDSKASAFAEIVKIGRTHLQDATPLTLGQEFSGYVAQLDLAERAIGDAMRGLMALAIGGTAVGTGLNAPARFGPIVAGVLAAETGHPFESAPNKFAALAGHEPMLTAHSGLRTLSAALSKIANDIRWLASGPRSGLGEIRLPANEPGSSIMPGKVNPTQCEAMTMVCAQVFGNDVAVGMAGASGQFELNVYKPLIIHAFLQSTRLLADAMHSFERHCVRGIEADRARIGALLDASLMLVTALTPHIGYDKAAAIAKRAHAEGLSLQSAALASGWVSEAEFARWVDPRAMV